MKHFGLVLVLAVGCTNNDGIEPTAPPAISSAPVWMRGQENAVILDWPAQFTGCGGSNNALCDPTELLELQVDSVTCTDGCTITSDPSGGASGGRATIRAIGTQDGPLTIAAHVTYAPTGQQYATSITVDVDHETGVSVSCLAVDRVRLADFLAANDDIEAIAHSCDLRRHTDAIIVTPVTTTAHGRTLTPFVPDGTIVLDDTPDPNTRWLSTVTLNPSPSSWDDINAIYTNPDELDHIDLQTTLSTGQPASARFAIAPACASPGQCPHGAVAR